MSFDKETNIETLLVDIETLPPIGYDRVIHYVDTELARIKPIYDTLLQARHDLYDMSISILASSVRIRDQTYDENSYNSRWTKADLRHRKNGVDFHNEQEKLDDEPSDTEGYLQRKKAYRQSIIEAAQELGGYLFPGPPGASLDPRDRHLGVRESTFSPETPVIADAVIIGAAAGSSFHRRIHDSIRTIESGAIKTELIIIATGERTIPEAEKERIKAKGFQVADTEFDAAQHAFKALTGVSFEEAPTHSLPATYGTGTPETRFKSVTATIGGTDMKVIITEGGYDRHRRHDETSRPIGRASTEEAFYATLPFLDKAPGTIVIESHDAWIPYQEVIGNQVFGLYADKTVIATGPYSSDCIFMNDEGEIDIKAAQEVVDEIGKRHDDLVKLRLKAEELKNPEIALLGKLILPIPDMEEARKKREGYRHFPIKSPLEFQNEPLVLASDYGIAGQSYYSRPNALIDEGIPGVPKEVYLRKSIVETLQLINSKLDNPMITAFFGGEVELYIEEGVRLRSVQKRVREEDFPAYLRTQNPDWTEEQIKKVAENQIAAPSSSDVDPPPHETGAAVDMRLRYKQADKGFVSDSMIDDGHEDGMSGPLIYPDYFEHDNLNRDAETIRQRNNRRAFYNIVTGNAFGIHTGLVVNPIEFFHMSRHDQLAAKLSGQEVALYGRPPES